MPPGEMLAMLSWQDAEWLQPAWQQLVQARSRRMHALAIEAPPGLGVDELVQAYIAWLMCESQGPAGAAQQACGHCASCLWLASGQHPDLRLLRPDALNAAQEVGDEDNESKKTERKLSSEIRIEQVRSLESFMQIGAHRGGLRIVWVEPAHTMNRAAANALLKMLEEPGEGALWLLQTRQFSALLPTIRSRCIGIRVRPPSELQAKSFLLRLLEASNHGADEQSLSLALGLSSQAPWAAHHMLIQPELAEQGLWFRTLAKLPQAWFSDLAARWADHSPELWFAVLERWAYDLLQAFHGLEPMFFKNLAAEARSMTQGKHAEDCLRLIEHLAKMKASLRHPLNPRLHAESALIAYARFVN